eukprot:tig00000498_g1581.t1
MASRTRSRARKDADEVNQPMAECGVCGSWRNVAQDVKDMLESEKTVAFNCALVKRSCAEECDYCSTCLKTEKSGKEEGRCLEDCDGFHKGRHFTASAASQEQS